MADVGESAPARAPLSPHPHTHTDAQAFTRLVLACSHGHAACGGSVCHRRGQLDLEHGLRGEPAPINPVVPCLPVAAALRHSSARSARRDPPAAAAGHRIQTLRDFPHDAVRSPPAPPCSYRNRLDSPACTGPTRRSRARAVSRWPAHRPVRVQLPHERAGYRAALRPGIRGVPACRLPGCGPRPVHPLWCLLAIINLPVNIYAFMYVRYVRIYYFIIY